MPEFATLNFDATEIRVAGSNVAGSVDINVNEAQNLGLDCIKVVLKGVLKNIVTRQNGASLFPSPNRHADVLVSVEETIWTPGSTSEKQLDTRNRPFSLTLPKNSPSSFQYKSRDPGQQSHLKYSIKVVGLRSGLFKSNLKHKVYFPVVSMHSVGFDDRLALVQGWNKRPMFHLIKNHAVHKNVVGAKLAETAVNFKIPEMDAYPIGYPIPYEITASITYDKNQSTGDDKADSKSVALPSPQAITFVLQKYHRIQAYGKLGVPHDDIGKTTIANLLDLDKVQVERKPLEFIPSAEGSETGKWRQEMTLRGHFVNNDCGDYLLRALKVNYTIDLTVPFQGLMNNVIYITPIKFTRGPIDDFVENSEALKSSVAASDNQVDLPKYHTRLSHADEEVPVTKTE